MRWARRSTRERSNHGGLGEITQALGEAARSPKAAIECLLPPLRTLVGLTDSDDADGYTLKMTSALMLANVIVAVSENIKTIAQESRMQTAILKAIGKVRE